MIYLYVIFFSILLILVNEFINKKLGIRELQREIREKIKNRKKLTEKEIFDLYKKQIKIFQLSLLINTILIIIYFISLQPFEVIKTNENYTEIYIRNPLLKNSDFYIHSNGLNGIFIAENGIIRLNKSENIKIEPVILILPFNIPLINKNWLGIIGSFIIFSLLINLVFLLIKALIRFPRLEIKNG